MLKGLSGSLQKEVGSMILDTGGKVVPGSKVAENGSIPEAPKGLWASISL